MKKMWSIFLALVLVFSAGIFSTGCGGGKSDSGKGAVPTFIFDYSEYISWSTFGQMCKERDENGELYVDARAGVQGSIEKKWNIDLEVRAKDYEACFETYVTGSCDFTCLTNGDTLPLSLQRPAVAILPTSTSYGADALIVVPGINSLEDLKSNTSYGLERSVSEYCFIRSIRLLGGNEANFKFSQKDPVDASILMQQGDNNTKAIMVWNPMLLHTLDTRKDCKVLFNSTSIPGEIIDLVVAGQDSLDKPGADRAACAIIETYYTLCELAADKKTQDKTLDNLGKEFKGGIGLDIMRKMVSQSRFYSTPEQGISLFTGGCVFPWEKDVTDVTVLMTNAGFKPNGAGVTDKTLVQTMPDVVNLLVEKGWVERDPSVGYGTKKSIPGVSFRFDPTYMKEVASK